MSSISLIEFARSRTRLLLALAMPLAGCAAASVQQPEGRTQRSARPAAPPPWLPPSGAQMAAYGCAQSGIPLGEDDFLSGILVDLDSGRWAWFVSLGPSVQREGPAQLSTTQLAEFRHLAAEVQSDPSRWSAEPAQHDSQACSLSVGVSGARTLTTVQRQTETGDQPPERLIRRLLALRPRGLRP